MSRSRPRREESIVKHVYPWMVKVAPWLVLPVLLTLVPAGWISSKIETNNTIHTFLAQRDPDLAFYNEITERFGGDLLVYASVDLGDGGVFTPDGLGLVEQVTGAMAQLDGVVRVSSLAATDAIFDEGGVVEPGPLMRSAPSTIQEAKRIEDKVYSSALLPWYVSPDRSATLVIAEVDPKLGAAETNAVVHSIHQTVATFEGRGARFALAGNPVVAEAIDRFNARDQQLFSGLMLLLVALSSALWLRRLSAAILPVTVVLVTVLWTTGIFVTVGHQTNWVTAIISPILFLVGVASATHFLAMYQESLRTAASRREAIVAAAEAVTVPCLFTSLTTAVGFASLMANQILPVRVFGLFAAIGVMLAFAAAMILVPAGLRFAGRRKASPLPRAHPSRALAALDRTVQGHPGLVVLVSLLVVVPLAAGMLFIRVETNMLSYFQQSKPVVQHSLEIERVYGGAAPLDIVLDTGETDGTLDPAFLRSVADLQDRLEGIGGVSRGISQADLMRDLHLAMAGDAATDDLPPSAAAAYHLLMLPDPEWVGRIVDPDYRSTRISTRFAGAGMGLKKARVLLTDIEDACAEVFGDRAEVRLTGSSLLFVNMDHYLVTGQIRSLCLVLTIIAVIMVALFRSLRMGLMAMIPNVLPIAVMMGLMGWLDLPLDGLTVMIACIAIGIGVDDTIHYLHHFRRELSRGADVNAAMSHTVATVGRAIVFTSIVLTLGFWIFCISDFVGTRNFGFLTGVTVVVALLADLLVLPAVILLVGVPKGWGR